MNGKTVARRSTRVFEDDSVPHSEIYDMTTTYKKATPGRDEKDAEKREHSRNSSTDSSQNSSLEHCAGLHNMTKEDIRNSERFSGAEFEEEETPENKVFGQPVNFGTIFPGVYRSGYPQTEDFDYLQKFDLKTILTLVTKEPPMGYEAFMHKNGIKHIVIDMQGTKKATIAPEMMSAIVRIVLDRRNQPILVHCNHGKHRTGCVAAVLRKALGWDLGSVLQEYRMYSDPKAREADVGYISGFDVESLSSIVASSKRTTICETVCDVLSYPLRFSSLAGFAKITRMLLLAAAVLCIWAISISYLRQV